MFLLSGHSGRPGIDLELSWEVAWGLRGRNWSPGLNVKYFWYSDVENISNLSCHTNICRGASPWLGWEGRNVIDIKVTGTTTLLGLDLKNWFVWIKLAQEHIRKLNTQISASGTRELSLIIIQCIALHCWGCIWPRGLRLRKVRLFPRPSFVTNWSLSLFLF